MQVFIASKNDCRVMPLGERTVISRSGQLSSVPESDTLIAGIILACRGSNGNKVAVLLAGDQILLYQGARPLPLTVLMRGAEIRIGGVSLFFTNEAPLRIVPFEPRDGYAADCTRCHRPLQPGEPVVYCPICELPYMAQPDKDPNCWHYSECLGCKRDPRVEFVWRPDMAIRKTRST